MAQVSNIDELVSDFSLLDEWEDRYRYVIELGRDLEPLPESERTPATKVQGCVSQVWIKTDVQGANGGSPVLEFRGDSDAHIVRGLIAILFMLFSGRTAEEILQCDAARRAGPAWARRASDAAALQRALRHGQAHPGRRRGRPCGARSRLIPIAGHEADLRAVAIRAPVPDEAGRLEGGSLRIRP
jgi:cysteine desulfuration protein SufE